MHLSTYGSFNSCRISPEFPLSPPPFPQRKGSNFQKERSILFSSSSSSSSSSGWHRHETLAIKPNPHQPGGSSIKGIVEEEKKKKWKRRHKPFFKRKNTRLSTFPIATTRRSVVVTQPPTVAGKMGARLEHVHDAYMFLHPSAPICNAQSVLVDKNFCIGAQSEVY